MSKWTRLSVSVMVAWSALGAGLMMAEGGEHHAADPSAILHHRGMYFIFHAINLIIFLVVMYRLLRGPVHAYLVKRQDTVREALERAEEARLTAERRAREYEARLAGLDDELRRMKEESDRLVQAEVATLLANARAQAARLEQDSQRLLQDELVRARYQLRKEAIDLAVRLAEGMLRERMTSVEQNRLFKDYLEHLSNSPEIH